MFQYRETHRCIFTYKETYSFGDTNLLSLKNEVRRSQTWTSTVGSPRSSMPWCGIHSAASQQLNPSLPCGRFKCYRWLFVFQRSRNLCLSTSTDRFIATTSTIIVCGPRESLKYQHIRLWHTSSSFFSIENFCQIPGTEVEKHLTIFDMTVSY